MDEIMVNLKLLGRVGKHQKINTRDTYLNVEAVSLVPECIRRWRRGDDRNSGIAKINNVICAAIELLPSTPSLKEPLLSAVVGITNLKETYSGCMQTCARLDTILDKITSLNLEDKEKEKEKEKIEE